MVMSSPQTNVFVFFPDASTPSPVPTLPLVFTYVVGTVLIFPFLIARPFQSRPHLNQPMLLLAWCKNHKTARIKNLNRPNKLYK
jgi:hypothetical protein